MKKLVLYISLLVLIASGAEAQKKQNNPLKNKPPIASSTKEQSALPAMASEKNTTLTSTSSNQAMKPAIDSFTIADPIIRALDANAKGANIKLSPSGLIGVPRGTYGFANGKVILYSSGATSTGTITGMGSVGTGTSPGVVGSSGPAMGVNGKNPYAAPGAYGTRIPFAWRPIIGSSNTKTLKNK